jgi:hypothetical protein
VHHDIRRAPDRFLPVQRFSAARENASTWLGRLKARLLLGGNEARPARAHTILSILVLLWCWSTAYLVALNDIDFFSFADLFDTAHPHHEHIVVALLIGGIVAGVIIFLWGRRAEQRIARPQ